MSASPQCVLTLVDESPTGKVLNEVQLVLVSSTVTARALITQRVRAEVARFEADGSAVYKGLVQPADTEAEPNGYRLRVGRRVDAEEQCRLALLAFERNGFVMFANDRQVESLDEPIVVSPGTQVSFVKLLPLVGG